MLLIRMLQIKLLDIIYSNKRKLNEEINFFKADTLRWTVHNNIIISRICKEA